MLQVTGANRQPADTGKIGDVVRGAPAASLPFDCLAAVGVDAQKSDLEQL